MFKKMSKYWHPNFILLRNITVPVKCWENPQNLWKWSQKYCK